MSNYLALMCGTDIPIPECQITLHQPTLKEISYLGEVDFFAGIQCICIDKKIIDSEDENVLSDISNFQVFMMVMSDKKLVEKKQKTKGVLPIIFPDYQVVFSPRSLIFTKEDKSYLVDESNFDVLQNVLKEVFCLSSDNDHDSFNPSGSKAEEIAKKLMRGRKRIAAEKNAHESEGGALAKYMSILAVGLKSMSLEDIQNLTIYQLRDLVQRFTLFFKWDLDIKQRLAGGKPEEEPENWMKNIH